MEFNNAIEGSKMKLENILTIDGEKVEYVCKFLGFSVYCRELNDAEQVNYFVDGSGKVVGYIEVTSSGSMSVGDHSSCDAEFITI
tara:strand:+ start:486 stop:740 length:255 start_codon:yes stop_codon:yes gene_type:complete